MVGRNHTPVLVGSRTRSGVSQPYPSAGGEQDKQWCVTTTPLQCWWGVGQAVVGHNHVPRCVNMQHPQVCEYATSPGVCACNVPRCVRVQRPQVCARATSPGVCACNVPRCVRVQRSQVCARATSPGVCACNVPRCVHVQCSQVCARATSPCRCVHVQCSQVCMCICRVHSKVALLLGYLVTKGFTHAQRRYPLPTAVYGNNM